MADAFRDYGNLRYSTPRHQYDQRHEPARRTSFHRRPHGTMTASGLLQHDFRGHAVSGTT